MKYIITIIFFLVSISAFTQNRTLYLNGDSAYMELPATIFKGLNEATIDMWVKWEQIQSFARLFAYGKKGNEIGINNKEGLNSLQAYSYHDWQVDKRELVDFIRTKKWYHIALAIKANRYSFFVNGQLVGEFTSTNDLKSYNSGDAKCFIGKPFWKENDYFRGEIDNIRIWNIALSPLQVKQSLYEVPEELSTFLMANYNFESGLQNKNTFRLRNRNRCSFKHTELPEKSRLSEFGGLKLHINNYNSDKQYFYKIYKNNRLNKRIEYPQIQNNFVHYFDDFTAEYSVIVYYDEFTASQIDIKPEQGKVITLDFNLYKTTVCGIVLDEQNNFMNSVLIEALLWDKKSNTYIPHQNVYSNSTGQFCFNRLISDNSYLFRCHTDDSLVYFGNKKPTFVKQGKNISNIDFKIQNFRNNKINVKHYEHPDGLKNFAINYIEFTDDRVLLFGTNRGVYYYEGNDFVPYITDERILNSSVTYIFSDNSNDLWIGTENNYLFHYHNGKTTHYNEFKGIHQKILSIGKTKQNTIYVAFKYEPAITITENNQISNVNFSSYLSNFCKVFSTDKNGNFIIGTANGVIYLTDRDTIRLLNNLIIHSIETTDNSLIFGTEYSIRILDSYKAVKEKRIVEALTEADKFPTHSVISMPENTLWTRNDDYISRIKNNRLISFPIKANCLCKVNDHLLAGTDNGFYVFDNTCIVNYSLEKKSDILYPEKRILQLTDYPSRSSKACKLRAFFRFDSFITNTDKMNNVWYIKPNDGDGIYYQNADKSINITTENGLTSNFANCIFCDNDSTIWVGTSGGASRIKVSSKGNYKVENSILQNYHNVFNIFRDTDSILWFIAQTGNLTIQDDSIINHNEKFKWVQSNNSITTYTYDNFFADKRKYPIADYLYQDSDGVMWFAKPYGFVGYDGNTTTIIDKSDGLLSNNIIDFEQDKNGSFWLTTDKGVSVYRKNHTKPELKILKIIVDTTYNNSNDLPKFEAQRRIEIVLTATDLKTFGRKMQYQYRILQIDSTWSRPDNNNIISWIPKDKGNYTLQFKAIDRDLMYSKPITVKFRIKPLWYKSHLFFVFFILFIALTVFGIFMIYKSAKQKQRIRKMKDEMLEQEKIKNVSLAIAKKEIETTNEKLIELDDFKQGMTSMIVHDFKNPLNILLNMTTSISQKKLLQKTKFVGGQLLNMTMNMLEIQKFKNSNIKLYHENISLCHVIDKIIQQVEYLADEKNIKIANNVNCNYIVEIDKYYIERVFVNLLTNAIKYSPLNSEVIIGIEKTTSAVIKCTITDSGEGIPADNADLIFEQFGQVKAKSSGKIRSTGLGLAFCKMAIEAHEQNIGFESEASKGTTFWFTLKLKNIEKGSRVEAVQHQKEMLNLSKTDEKYLQPFAEILTQFHSYEITKIRNVLKSIHNNTTEIKKWKDEITKSSLTRNDRMFEELVERVRNEE